MTVTDIGIVRLFSWSVIIGRVIAHFFSIHWELLLVGQFVERLASGCDTLFERWICEWNEGHAPVSMRLDMSLISSTISLSALTTKRRALWYSRKRKSFWKLSCCLFRIGHMHIYHDGFWNEQPFSCNSNGRRDIDLTTSQDSLKYWYT